MAADSQQLQPSPRVYFEPRRVRELFDEMSATYGLVNLVASFGFARRWRRQCAQLLPLQPGEHAIDLMSGMGECWEFVLPRIGPEGALVAADFSRAMTLKAIQHKERWPQHAVDVREENVFHLPDARTPAGAFDALICSFGLKTLPPEAAPQLAELVRALLRPGGGFAFVEISVPPAKLLRPLYMFYLKRLIPWIGKLFLGNPDNYRMLGWYTDRFQNCAAFAQAFRAAGLEVREQSLFFGCATAFYGFTPVT